MLQKLSQELSTGSYVKMYKAAFICHDYLNKQNIFTKKMLHWISLGGPDADMEE